MPNLTERWVTRAKEILANPHRDDLVPFAVSFLTAIYGSNSPQMDTFSTTLSQIAKSAPNLGNASHHQTLAASGGDQEHRRRN